MFGFKARARARAEKEAAESAAFDREIHKHLSHFVAAVLAEYGGQEPFATCAYDLQLGIDAVLLKGATAFSEELNAAGEDVSSGGMIAGAARGTAYVTGRVEAKYLDDMRFRMNKHAAQ